MVLQISSVGAMLQLFFDFFRSLAILDGILRLSFTPCSAAVRAQHIRRLPKGEPCVLDSKHWNLLYCLPVRLAFRIRLQIPSSKAFPHPFVPSPGPARTAQPAQKLGVKPFLGLKMRFCCLPKIILFFASIFSRKKCKNHGFWPPKTLPKSIQNAFKIDVPQNLHFFIDFLLILVVFGFVRFFLKVLKT